MRLPSVEAIQGVIINTEWVDGVLYSCDGIRQIPVISLDSGRLQYSLVLSHP